MVCQLQVSKTSMALECLDRGLCRAMTVTWLAQQQAHLQALVVQLLCHSRLPQSWVAHDAYRRSFAAQTSKYIPKLIRPDVYIAAGDLPSLQTQFRSVNLFIPLRLCQRHRSMILTASCNEGRKVSYTGIRERNQQIRKRCHEARPLRQE